jgi:hypothetical protein
MWRHRLPTRLGNRRPAGADFSQYIGAVLLPGEGGSILERGLPAW